MTAKIYAYLGKNYASIDIPVGAAGAVKVEFTGGNINDTKAYSLAKTKPIYDEAVQAVIEGSPYYGGKVILFEVREDEDPGAEKVMKEYPDVTNFAEACAVLKADYQAKAAQLRSPAGVKALAESFGVAFPNWN